MKKENFCSTCGQELKPGDLSVRCRLCMHNYHASCWERGGGCTTWGCAGNTAAADGEQSKAPDYKRCSFCGEKIISFAERCRYCRSRLDLSETKNGEKSLEQVRPDGPGFRKDPILTGILNLIFPGAGYMYLGQFNKGLFWFLVAVAAWFFTRGLGLVAVYFWVIYDSVRQAINLNRGGPQPPRKKTMQRP